MKKLLILALAFSISFATTNAQINQKLNLILDKMNKMEKQLNSKDQEIQKLRHEVKQQKIETKKEFLVNSCDKIKVTQIKYNYNANGGIIPYYTIKLSLQNKYPYAIRNFAGKLLLKDKDDTTILTEYIQSNKSLNKNQTIQIKKNHPINSQLENSLKEINPANIKAIFTPSNIVFTNGKQVKCGGIF